jgi:Glycine rich protein
MWRVLLNLHLLLALMAFSAVEATIYLSNTTFLFTGSVQNFTVPSGIHSLFVDVRGAAGGDATSVGRYTGGLGGRVTAFISVTPGQKFHVFVGAQGAPSGNVYCGNGMCTGNGPSLNNHAFNGGGAVTCAGYWMVGGGGGASDIRTQQSLDSRLVVAGGGGGGGETIAGAGGGLVGGQVGYGTDCAAQKATGGTQTAGGLGAGPDKCNPSNECSTTAGAGTFGNGGDGSCDTGSGGGGGWWGGGGGYRSAGGGGSSYTVPSATNVNHYQGVQPGNGVVIISTIVSPAGLPSASPAAPPKTSSSTSTSTSTSRKATAKRAWGRKSATDVVKSVKNIRAAVDYDVTINSK